MSHKKEWAKTIKYVRNDGVVVWDTRSILAADRIVRAAVAVDRARMGGGGSLTSKLDTLHRAVENFEREGEG